MMEWTLVSTNKSGSTTHVAMVPGGLLFKQLEDGARDTAVSMCFVATAVSCADWIKERAVKG